MAVRGSCELGASTTTPLGVRAAAEEVPVGAVVMVVVARLTGGVCVGN